MVARSDFQRVLRSGSGRRPAGHPLSGPRDRRMVQAVRVLRIQLAPRKKNQVLVHLAGTEPTKPIAPIELALDVMERSGIHVGDDVPRRISRSCRKTIESGGFARPPFIFSRTDREPSRSFGAASVLKTFRTRSLSGASASSRNRGSSTTMPSHLPLCAAGSASGREDVFV